MQARWLWVLVVALCLGIGTVGLRGQDFPGSFEDNLEDDPVETGWRLQGSATWVEPGVEECLDAFGFPDPNTFDPLLPCTLYSEDAIEERLGIDAEEFGGYILVTPAVGDRIGSAFRASRDEDGNLIPVAYNNFRMDAIVELRDGSVGQPADGMTVVLIEQQDHLSDEELEDLALDGLTPQDPEVQAQAEFVARMDRNNDGIADEFELAGMPGTGAGGGAMGATGLGAVKTLVFEFDNWNCNAGDNNDQNHVGFSYSPTGFPAVDAITNNVFVPINEGNFPLHNRQTPAEFEATEGAARHVDPNRYQMTVFVQGGVVAFKLVALDRGPDDDGDDVPDGVDLGILYTYEIPDFESFNGFLGVTGSTGGAWQNQILHFASVQDLGDTCISPAGQVARSFDLARDPKVACGDYAEGDDISVDLTIVNLREELLREDGGVICPAASRVVIVETPPAGWDVSSISAGGVYDADAGTVTWDIDGATAGMVVSYTATATTSDAQALFSGRVQEGTSDTAREFAGIIVGEASLKLDDAFDDCGGITCWNLLGAFQSPGGAAPGEDAIRRDYMTDGSVSEIDFVWFPGAQIATSFGVAAASPGLFNDPNGRNPDGIPTVVSWNDDDNYINLNNDVYGGNPDNVMAYGQAYIINDTGDDIEVELGISSDDSVQVLLNGEEVWINNIPRGGSSACTPQDISPDGVVVVDAPLLLAGENSLIVKTFEGGGDFNFSIVIREFGTGIPLTDADGIFIAKYPEGVCPVAPLVVTRDVETGRTANVLGVERIGWQVGDTYEVTLNVTDVRPADLSEACPDAPSTVTIREVVPVGWEVSDISDGGELADGVITWTLTGAAIAEGALTYTVRACGDLGNVALAGSTSEPGSPISFPTKGVGRLYNPPDFSEQGFVTKWLLLGAYLQPGGLVWGPFANPNENSIRRDLLTDGGTDEFEIEPVAGDTIDTDFRGASPAPGLAGGTRSAQNNPDGVPTWNEWNDTDSNINFDDYYGGNVDNCMMYAVTYVLVEEDMTVDIGVGSDDSIQVLLDGEEIWINSIPRGVGANQVQDVISSATVDLLNPLEAGLHKIMVKVYEGGGGHQMLLRFQDPVTAEPITEGLTVCLDPDGEGCERPSCDDVGGPAFARGDSDASGVINLNDGIVILNFLFLGLPAPACLDAADTDDGGSLLLNDAISIFNWLFIGGAPPVEPSPSTGNYPPEDCGVDAGGELGCATAPAKCS